MSLEDREAKVKQLNSRENRLSLTAIPTNNSNNNNHTHGSASGQGLGPSKAVTFSTEESDGDGDGNELSEEDLRYSYQPCPIIQSTSHPFTHSTAHPITHFKQSIILYNLSIPYLHPIVTY